MLAPPLQAVVLKQLLCSVLSQLVVPMHSASWVNRALVWFTAGGLRQGETKIGPG